ncbi:hypothetical protein SEA_NANOSMITE_161 [Mycobacterium phage Nanosmite]|nr:hypothetical protein SEA_NANOSMITE_161 [Mycobacterium phage Nanosmite]
MGNSIYEHFYGPGNDLHLECPACLFELMEIGPLQGPDRPPKRRRQRVWVYRPLSHSARF